MRYVIVAVLLASAIGSASAGGYTTRQVSPNLWVTTGPRGEQWTTRVDPNGSTHTQASPYNQTIPRDVCGWDQECRSRLFMRGIQ